MKNAKVWVVWGVRGHPRSSEISPFDREHMTSFEIFSKSTVAQTTSCSAIAEGPRDVLVSRSSPTAKYRYRVALFA